MHKYNDNTHSLIAPSFFTKGQRPIEYSAINIVKIEEPCTVPGEALSNKNYIWDIIMHGNKQGICFTLLNVKDMAP